MLAISLSSSPAPTTGVMVRSPVFCGKYCCAVPLYCFRIELLIGFYRGRGHRPIEEGSTVAILIGCGGLFFLWRGRRHTAEPCIYCVFLLYDCAFFFIAWMRRNHLVIAY